MYQKFTKRIFDILISFFALALSSPLLLMLILFGSIFMKGNPFFVQSRPGKNEKIFKLIKFRSMNNKRDSSGELLPDMERLGRYGSFLRNTSLDELPELINILKGDMSIVGPRPLLVSYLPLYNERQKHRHDVTPGLTGWAQVNGRNSISWEEKFDLDLYYVENLSFSLDLKIIFLTVKTVFVKEGISNSAVDTMPDFTGTKE